MRNTDRTCWKCQGTGRVSVYTRVESLSTLVTNLAESIIPLYAGTIRCPKCRGKGYYLTIRER